MPRLSVILPHLTDERQLETTLLSILQGRDPSVEVLLVHANNYSDPYQLDGDEISLVTMADDSSATSLINAAIEKASGSIVQCLMPGTTLSDHWYADVLPAFADSRIGSVAAAIHLTSKSTSVIGLDAEQLPRSEFVPRLDSTARAFPLLNGGYFRREFLECVNGLFSEAPLAVAQTELALAQQSLKLQTARFTEPKIFADAALPKLSTAGFVEGQQLGRLAAAYAALPQSPIHLDSLPVRMGRLAASLFNPISVAHRLGWTLGVQERSMCGPIAERIESAATAWQRYLADSTYSQADRRRAA